MPLYMNVNSITVENVNLLKLTVLLPVLDKEYCLSFRLFSSFAG